MAVVEACCLNVFESFHKDQAEQLWQQTQHPIGNLCSKLGEKVSPPKPKIWGTRAPTVTTLVCSQSFFTREEVEGHQQGIWQPWKIREQQQQKNSQRRPQSHLKEWLRLGGFIKAPLQDKIPQWEEIAGIEFNLGSQGQHKWEKDKV